jgi:hypothetical protein
MARAAFQTFPKITNITTEIWTEQVPVCDPDYEIQTVDGFRALIWLEVEGGGVYARDLQTGESLPEVVEAYRKAGHIDDGCCFVAAP